MVDGVTAYTIEAEDKDCNDEDCPGDENGYPQAIFAKEGAEVHDGNESPKDHHSRIEVMDEGNDNDDILASQSNHDDVIMQILKDMVDSICVALPCDTIHPSKELIEPIHISATTTTIENKGNYGSPPLAVAAANNEQETVAEESSRNDHDHLHASSSPTEVQSPSATVSISVEVIVENTNAQQRELHLPQSQSPSNPFDLDEVPRSKNPFADDDDDDDSPAEPVTIKKKFIITSSSASSPKVSPKPKFIITSTSSSKKQMAAAPSHSPSFSVPPPLTGSPTNSSGPPVVLNQPRSRFSVKSINDCSLPIHTLSDELKL